jgi:FkbM family methyltransferase
MFVNKILALLNLRITRKTTFDKLFQKAFCSDDYRQQVDVLLTSELLRDLRWSKSQFEQRQDMFVLAQLNFKTGGFFVEFGAANGVDLSNTYLLEKNFGWYGILAEPSKSFHQNIFENRNCHFEKKCVWKNSEEILTFRECEIGELSTLSQFTKDDVHKDFRANSTEYKVETISLNDLLVKYDAPEIIDYLSIDTEGSEYEILNSFNFDRFRFRLITCEHNFASREKIYNLLSSKGYRRVFENLSKCDDWYICDTL